VVGGPRAGPGRSHATRSGQTGSAPACLAPRLLQTTTHIAWELGFLSESEAGGKTGGRLSDKRAIPSDWQGIRLLTQAERERRLRTAGECQGKGRRPFADLCLTTWLRRRRGHNFARAFEFLNPQERARWLHVPTTADRRVPRSSSRRPSHCCA